MPTRPRRQARYLFVALLWFGAGTSATISHAEDKRYAIAFACALALTALTARMVDPSRFTLIVRLGVALTVAELIALVVSGLQQNWGDTACANTCGAPKTLLALQAGFWVFVGSLAFLVVTRERSESRARRGSTPPAESNRNP